MSNLIELEITRIKKDNGNHYDPYEAVEAYEWYQPSSGLKGVASRQKMVGWLDSGYKGAQVVAYVEQVKPAPIATLISTAMVYVSCRLAPMP